MTDSSSPASPAVDRYTIKLCKVRNSAATDGRAALTARAAQATHVRPQRGGLQVVLRGPPARHALIVVNGLQDRVAQFLELLELRGVHCTWQRLGWPRTDGDAGSSLPGRFLALRRISTCTIKLRSALDPVVYLARATSNTSIDPIIGMTSWPNSLPSPYRHGATFYLYHSRLSTLLSPFLASRPLQPCLVAQHSRQWRPLGRARPDRC